MKLLRTLIAPLLAVTFVAGCGDDFVSDADSTPEEVAEALEGTWNATSFVFTNDANSSETFDLLGAGSFVITFTADGQFSGSSTLAGFTEGISGTYIVQGTNLITTDTGETESETFAFTLSGNTLTLTGDDEYDFNGDDVDVSATLTIIFQRA